MSRYERWALPALLELTMRQQIESYLANRSRRRAAKSSRLALALA